MISAGDTLPEGASVVAGGLSDAERVIDTFVAPSKTFADILRSSRWWLPFLLLAVVTLATSFVVDRQVGFARVAENQLHQNTKQSEQYETQTAEVKAKQLHAMSAGMRYSSYGSFVLILVFVAIFALVYWASFNFGLGAHATYGQMFAVWMYASLPKLFTGLLTIVTLYAGANSESYNIQNPVGTNVGYYMPDASPWLRSAMSFLDVFSFWQLALLVIGTALVAKVSMGKAAAVVLGWWVLGLIVSVGMAAAFS